MVYFLESAKDNFDIMLQVGAGTGLLYLLRWFWWRINAWCEVVAMISSFAVSIALLVLNRSGIGISLNLDFIFGAERGLLILKRSGENFGTAESLIITIAFTTVCWVLAAFFGPQTDRKILVDFYKKVRPFGPGWKSIREEAGISEEEARATHENMPLASIGWVAGCTVIWSSLFTVGNLLYGRTPNAILLFGVFVVSGLVLLKVINQLWSGKMVSHEEAKE